MTLYGPDYVPPHRRQKHKLKAPCLPEWLLQSHFVAELHRLEALGWPLTCAGDMNAARRRPSGGP